MRHFVAQMLERLLANQLRANQPLRLVGHHIVREILRAFRQVRRKLLRQVIQPVAGFGADWDNRVIAKVSEGRNQPQQLLRRQQVNLVDRQHLRHFLARHIADDGAVVLAHLRRVHQHQHAVHAVHRVLDGLHHAFAQLRAGRVDAGGVEEHNLPVRARHHAHDAVARRLRAAGDNRNLFADHRVHQGGFAHVRATHNRYKSRMKLRIFAHDFTPSLSAAAGRSRAAAAPAGSRFPCRPATSPARGYSVQIR